MGEALYDFISRNPKAWNKNLTKCKNKTWLLIELWIQLWTIKDNNSYILGIRIFWKKLRTDSNSDGQITSKKGVFLIFPWGFGCANFFALNFRAFWHVRCKSGGVLLIWWIARIDIIARCDTCWCCFCFFTVHAAAWPVNPRRYALIKRHERLMNQRMTSVGQVSRYFCTASFASWNDVLSTSR